MEHKVEREVVLPPVKKITLELSLVEFLSLFRSLGNSYTINTQSPQSIETDASKTIMSVSGGVLYSSLADAARTAGLIK